MNSGGTVLLIEDDKNWGQYLNSIIEFMGYAPVWISLGNEIRKDSVWHESPWVVIFGPSCVDPQAVDVLHEVKKRDRSLPIILITDPNTRSSIHQELVNIAFRCIDTPLKYIQLASVMQDLLEWREQHPQQYPPRIPQLFRSLVGKSSGIKTVRRLIEQAANSRANVLILGESGTGKEVVARNLHYFSDRRDEPFMPINCSAIPAELLESELFGHEKGASTGAVSDRQGRFEMAENGTLFLDEIGDISLHMQVKLLRILQERVFERVGSGKRIETNVRIIAATHTNLEQAIEQGNFREDLYYRLNVFPIEVPALRERREDIPLLVEELLRRCQHEKRISLKFTQRALQALSDYDWPGNVRELANLIERLAILCPSGIVDVSDLPKKILSNMSTALQLSAVGEQPPVKDLPAHPLSLPRLPREGIDLKGYLNSLEVSLIRQALEETGGVVAHAAARLGLRRTTLVEKLRKHGLLRWQENAATNRQLQ